MIHATAGAARSLKNAVAGELGSCHTSAMIFRKFGSVVAILFFISSIDPSVVLADPVGRRISPSAKIAGACALVFIAGAGTYFAAVHDSFPPPAPSFSGLPSAFNVTEKAITFWGDQFVIQNDQFTFGHIEEKVFAFTKTMTLYDPSGASILATGKNRFFAIGSKMDVFDPSGHPIATIQEHVFDSFFKVFTTYSIVDPSGSVLATSEKSEVFSTNIAVRDRSGRVVATLNRPAINWISDNWAVSIVPNGAIDPRVLVMIPAFKTSVDNDRRAKSSDK